MEEKKIIDKCTYGCGKTREVIPCGNGKMICAECLIELNDRIEGHYLPKPNMTNAKENPICHHALVATAL